MKIKELGETELIRRLFSIYLKGAESRVDPYPQDDCAVLDFGERYMLLTTDLINERTHVPQGASGFQLGWFLMAINLSDLAAKGGTPLGFLNALALPPELEEEFVEGIGAGMAACSKAYKCPIIGGDTKSSTELTLTGTAIGTVPKQQYIPRKGCGHGDIVAVTGEIGRAGIALRKLQDIPNTDENKALRAIYLKLILETKPQLWAGQMLAKLGYCHAGMDLSDGLGVAINTLAEQNEVGFLIDYEKIPKVPMLNEFEAEISNEEIEDIVLYAGGDYELLVCISPAYYDTTEAALKRLGVTLTPIGSVEFETDLIVKTKESEKKLEKKGFNHFN